MRPDTAVKNLFKTLMGRNDVRSATVYLSPFYIIRLTRQHKANNRHNTMVLTEGRPNYLEREFVRLALNAGQKFPIRKPILRFWPKKRSKK